MDAQRVAGRRGPARPGASLYSGRVEPRERYGPVRSPPTPGGITAHKANPWVRGARGGCSRPSSFWRWRVVWPPAPPTKMYWYAHKLYSLACHDSCIIAASSASSSTSSVALSSPPCSPCSTSHPSLSIVLSCASFARGKPKNCAATPLEVTLPFLGCWRGCTGADGFGTPPCPSSRSIASIAFVFNVRSRLITPFVAASTPVVASRFFNPYTWSVRPFARHRSHSGLPHWQHLMAEEEWRRMDDAGRGIDVALESEGGWRPPTTQADITHLKVQGKVRSWPIRIRVDPSESAGDKMNYKR